MAHNQVYKFCEVCGGDGLIDVADSETGSIIHVECYHCKGAKKFLWGQIEKS